MLNIRSTVKLAWVYGDETSQFPEEMPLYELFRDETRYGWRVANTDEVSVIVVPDGEHAELIVKSEEEYPGLASPIKISLNTSMKELREIASIMAQRATMEIIKRQEQFT